MAQRRKGAVSWISNMPRRIFLKSKTIMILLRRSSRQRKNNTERHREDVEQEQCDDEVSRTKRGGEKTM